MSFCANDTLKEILLFSSCSAKDIKELKIVKSSTEAQTQLPKQATPSKLSKETAKELDYVPSPGRIREVTPTATREATTNECGDSGFNSINGQRNYSNHESYNSGYAQSSSSNNYMSVSDRYMQEGNGHVSPLRHTPTKDRGEECNYRNRGTPNRDRSEEGFNGNGNRNGARHTPTKDENFRGRKNSGSVLMWCFAVFQTIRGNRVHLGIISLIYL